MKQISNVTPISAVMQWWGGVAVFCWHSFKFSRSRCCHFTQFLSAWPDEDWTERVLVVRLWSSLFGSTLGIPSNASISLLWVICSLWVSARVLSCGCNIWTSSVRRHPHHIRTSIVMNPTKASQAGASPEEPHPRSSSAAFCAEALSLAKILKKHRLSLQEGLYNS